MQRTLTLCDVCRSQENVLHCVVTIARRRAAYDLCPEHRAPLEELVTKAHLRRASVLEAAPFLESIDDLVALRARKVDAP